MYTSAADRFVAVGASFTAVTVRLAVSEAVENSVVPPLVEASAVPPSVPLV